MIKRFIIIICFCIWYRINVSMAIWKNFKEKLGDVKGIKNEL